MQTHGEGSGDWCPGPGARGSLAPTTSQAVRLLPPGEGQRLQWGTVEITEISGVTWLDAEWKAADTSKPAIGHGLSFPGWKNTE